MLIYLMAESCENEMLSFEYIYNKYKNMVWANICDFIADEQLRADIMQEVFVKLHMSMGKLQSEKAIKRWLVVVTKNTLIDMNRKETNFKRYMNVYLEEDDILDGCMDMLGDMPLDEVVKKSAADELMEVLRELKPIHYDVIIMHYFLEFTPAEIAKRQNVSVNTVYSRLTRAREVLYSRISESLKEYYLGGVSYEKQ